MLYLTKKQIIEMNRLTIFHYGGNFIPPNNVLNESPLDYLVEIVYAEMFGKPLCPSFFVNASVIVQYYCQPRFFGW